MTDSLMFTAAHQLPIKLIKQINHTVGGVSIKTNLQRAIYHGYESGSSINNSPSTIHILLHIISAFRHRKHLKNKNPTAQSLSDSAIGGHSRMTRDELIVQIGLLKAEDKQEQSKIATPEPNIIRLRREIRELKRQVFNATPLVPEGGKD
ncbi:hypothetical protein HNQ68_001939 [Pseudochrobactrum saccharolyticum]|uniref:Uncharacterized protein n=1 Tax=Pseudochrobactrum saccharolyticum TaxID=354352 RepID=A0A7W8AJ98_9HYPH|nr:hypothetical protein [Pseudochrobactrum saccharolyticum]KAB0538165.1 hypothetical protein F7P81_10600 [Pseudochrobactrum saccharolyticum]MBB5091398.1 hypothetical protein [Pseudochrobactrum saccharolyticum]